MLNRVIFFIFLIMIFDLTFASVLVKVKSIHDGDTLTYSYLSDETTTFKGRLVNIDAPELKQPYGIESRKYLINLIKESQDYVNIDIAGKDYYNRNLVTVYSRDGLNINQLLVENGYAWSYDRKYRDLEHLAKINQRGLWADKNPIRPGEWRNLSKTVNSVNSSCRINGKVPSCANIKTCDEAKQYLKNCNIKTLDGNNNGIPCESICK